MSWVAAGKGVVAGPGEKEGEGADGKEKSALVRTAEAPHAEAARCKEAVRQTAPAAASHLSDGYH